MRKSLSYKILAALMAAGSLGLYAAASTAADNFNAPADGTIVNSTYDNVYGNGIPITITGGTIYGDVYGVGNGNYDEDASGGNVTINGNANVSYLVYGGMSVGGSAHQNTVNISDGSVIKGYVYGGMSNSTDGSAHHNTVNISGGSVGSDQKSVNVYGGRADSTDSSAHHNTVNIRDGTIGSDQQTVRIFGGDSESGQAHHNIVNINGGSVGSDQKSVNVYGGRSGSGSAYDNKIIISGSADIENANLYGSNKSTDTGNTLTIDGWKGNNGSGDCTVKSLNNFNIIEFKNIKSDTGLTANSVNGMDKTQLILSSVDVTNLSNATNHIFGTITLSKNITNVIKDFTNKIDTTDLNSWNFNDNETSGIYAGYIANATATTNNNTITITGDIEKSVLTGVFIDESGNKHYKGSSTPDDTTDDTTTLTIGNGFDTKVATVAGVYAADKTDGTAQNAEKGVVNISGDNITYDGIVYAGYSESGSASGNIINVAAGTNAKNMTLSGTYNTGSDNVLNLAGSATFKAIYKFNAINFDKIDWINGGTVLNITNNTEEKALANTNINLKSLNFAGGAELNTGESMTIISNNDLGKDLGIGTGTGKIDALSNFTAGVAIEGTGTAEVASDGNSVKYTLTEVKHLDQIDLVAENRAVAAAFVNQGTDLISDSLDTISRDSNYGVKTFAAVHGNRSKYDVNSDIKINGWSTIVGVGNADKFDNGNEFSWGVFYENGSGNYRTFNEFNNEFFRGDGSFVYNGGGIAARYTNKNGVYTEGSLRAGMLKSDMDNALRDGAGNFYGYESESAYYGAHLGIGKIISLSESSDLDVYGKFFHTYTEGDSFKVANDEFEFDSINSDRLRIGARITSNKENKFSTYYGLAYEYEFNGDTDMTAQGLKAPTQSLQGSSVMAEVGFNYQPTPDSPWSFDLNMRGYTGERQGGSFNVQATYTF